MQLSYSSNWTAYLKAPGKKADTNTRKKRREELLKLGAEIVQIEIQRKNAKHQKKKPAFFENQQIDKTIVK